MSRRRSCAPQVRDAEDRTGSRNAHVANVKVAIGVGEAAPDLLHIAANIEPVSLFGLAGEVDTEVHRDHR